MRASTWRREERSLPPGEALSVLAISEEPVSKPPAHHFDRAGHLLSEGELEVPGLRGSVSLGTPTFGQGGVEGGLAGHRLLEIQLTAQIVDQMRIRVLTEDLGQFLSQSNSSLFLALKAPN